MPLRQFPNCHARQLIQQHIFCLQERMFDEVVHCLLYWTVGVVVGPPDCEDLTLEGPMDVEHSHAVRMLRQGPPATATSGGGDDPGIAQETHGAPYDNGIGVQHPCDHFRCFGTTKQVHVHKDMHHTGESGVAHALP